MIGVDIQVKFENEALPLTSKAIRKALKTAIVIEGKAVERAYDYLQGHFSSDNRAPIKRKSGSGRSPVTGGPGSIYSAVGTNKERCVLVWLEAGTEVRYRTMSNDWTSMTYPDGGMRFGSSKGRAMGFGYHKGIKARNFRDDMISRLYPRFLVRADRMFQTMLKGARWI